MICFKAQLNGVPVVPFTKGGPGIGKTQMHRELARENDWQFKSIILSRYNSVDIMGLFVPDHKAGRLVHYPSSRLLETVDPDRVCLIMFDEITNAQPDVMSAIQSFLEDRQIEDVNVGSKVVFALAGNRPQDGCNSRELPRALKDGRLITFEIKMPDKDEWSRWAEKNQINPYVVAYIQWRPEDLYRFEGDSASATQPTPRGYEKLSAIMDVVNNPMDTESISNLGIGCIGESAWSGFAGFMRYAESMPTYEDIINDPTRAKLPPQNDFGCLYGVVSNLKSHVSYMQKKEQELLECDIKAICEYVDRMHNEFASLALKLLATSNEAFMSSKIYSEYAVKYHNLYI